VLAAATAGEWRMWSFCLCSWSVQSRQSVCVGSENVPPGSRRRVRCVVTDGQTAGGCRVSIGRPALSCTSNCMPYPAWMYWLIDQRAGRPDTDRHWANYRYDFAERTSAKSAILLSSSVATNACRKSANKSDTHAEKHIMPHVVL